jgi:hypothetical protein
VVAFMVEVALMSDQHVVENEMTMRDWALKYVEFGWAVFPLHSIEDGHCSCGSPACKSPGKHPRTKNGVKNASKDPAVICGWWAKWPTANVGIATGQVSGLVVVDIDGDNGLANWNTLTAKNSQAPSTLGVETARGQHLYFGLRPKVAVPNRANDGLDIRGDNGYVVAPPSNHASGIFYQWLRDAEKLAPAPDWLLAYAQGGHGGKPPRPAAQNGGSISGMLANVQSASPPSWSEAEAGRLRSALACIPAFVRDTGATWAPRFIGWRGTKKGFHIWDEWSRTCPAKYDEVDQRRTWESFNRAYNGTRITVATLVHTAQQHGWKDYTKLAPPHEGPTPLVPGSDGAEIARLAQLPPLLYERERKEAAKRLGCRESILDKVVVAARGETEDEHRQGQALDLREPDPWPEAVDGCALLSQLSAIFTGYVVMPHAAADATALWVMHAYLIEAADATPRLAIKSPEKRCGKTRLLSIIDHLAPRALATSNISPAAMFRTIQAAKPTLLIDEADTFVTMSEELRGVINSGHTRTTAYVVRTEGEDLQPRRFSTWAPIAFATIGRLPNTVEDRSITIPLRRRRPDEKVDRLRRNHVEHLHDVASRAARFAFDHSVEIAARDPDIPDQLHDRAADNWRPLLAIADAAGGEWPERARAAAITLSADSAADQDSMRTMLLDDVRSYFTLRASIVSQATPLLPI